MPKSLGFLAVNMGLSYLLTVLTAGIVAVSYFFLPPQIPLWYSLAIPEQQLASKLFLFLIPILMVFITFLHTFITQHLKSQEKTILRVFSIATTFTLMLFSICALHSILVIV